MDLSSTRTCRRRRTSTKLQKHHQNRRVSIKVSIKFTISLALSLSTSSKKKAENSRSSRTQNLKRLRRTHIRHHHQKRHHKHRNCGQLLDRRSQKIQDPHRRDQHRHAQPNHDASDEPIDPPITHVRDHTQVAVVEGQFELGLCLPERFEGGDVEELPALEEAAEGGFLLRDEGEEIVRVGEVGGFGRVEGLVGAVPVPVLDGR